MALQDLIDLKASYVAAHFCKTTLDLLVDEIKVNHDKIDVLDAKIDALEARVEELEG